MASSVPSRDRADVTVHPRLEQRDPLEARQPANGVVDLADRRAALVTREEIARQELELGAGLHTAADRRPEAIDQRARDPGRARTAQPRVGLAEVEEEVTRLVPDDPLQERAEHGM